MEQFFGSDPLRPESLDRLGLVGGIITGRGSPFTAEPGRAVSFRPPPPLVCLAIAIGFQALPTSG